MLKINGTVGRMLYVGGPAAQDCHRGSVSSTGANPRACTGQDPRTLEHRHLLFSGWRISMDLGSCNARYGWVVVFQLLPDNGSPVALAARVRAGCGAGPFALIGNVETITGYLSITGAITCNSSITSVGLGFTSHASGARRPTTRIQQRPTSVRQSTHQQRVICPCVAPISGYFWVRIRWDPARSAINSNAADQAGDCI